MYMKTNSSWLCIPDQGTPHNTTLPRDQFLIQTFAQLTSMITLANLTTLNILTYRIKIQNLHCLLCLIFFILFFSKYFHTLPFFTNQVFPLPNISLVFLLLQIFSHFSTQSSSVSQTRLFSSDKSVLLFKCNTLHTANSGPQHMLYKSIESLDKCPNHCHSILTSNYERSRWTNFHSMLRE